MIEYNMESDDGNENRYRYLKPRIRQLAQMA